MSTQHKLVLHRFFKELFNQGKLAAADELVSLHYVNHDPAPGETPGREGLKAFVILLRTAFPDLRFTVTDQLAEGDKVVTRFTATGTQHGEFAGIPATGKAITVTGMNIHRVVNGQIQEG